MARKTKQQAQETRQQILDAAVREFSERGVAATSLTDIATAAGVTRGAIYWHFKNKVDLFNEVWESTEPKIDQLETEYQAKFPDNPLRVIREILIYILTSTVEDGRRRALMEIIFHKCEFVGEMMPLLDSRKVLYLAGYERIEAVLYNCIHHEQLPADLHTRRAPQIRYADGSTAQRRLPAFIRRDFMSSVVLIANGAAYGHESLFNALRLAIALKEQQSSLDLRLFLMSDAVVAGLAGQQPHEGYHLQQMLEILTAQQVPVKLCKTCADARGVSRLPLADGVEIGTLVELAQWTLAAEKVLTF